MPKIMFVPSHTIEKRSNKCKVFSITMQRATEAQFKTFEFYHHRIWRKQNISIRQQAYGGCVCVRVWACKTKRTQKNGYVWTKNDIRLIIFISNMRSPERTREIVIIKISLPLYMHSHIPRIHSALHAHTMECTATPLHLHNTYEYADEHT